VNEWWAGAVAGLGIYLVARYGAAWPQADSQIAAAMWAVSVYGIVRMAR
jgi:hypothetical protein